MPQNADPGPESAGKPLEGEAQDESPADPGRRSFMGQLRWYATDMATQAAGIGGLLRRSVVAAGESVTPELEAMAEVEWSADRATERVTPPGLLGASSNTTAAPPHAPSPSPKPQLTAEQRLLLDRIMTLVLATNDPGSGPQLTSNPFHWDGEEFRISGLLLSAKVANVDRDPRVTLYGEDAPNRRCFVAHGTARIVAGPTVRSETFEILRRYHPENDLADRWREMSRLGDRVVVVVRPDRFLWRTS